MSLHHSCLKSQQIVSAKAVTLRRELVSDECQEKKEGSFGQLLFSPCFLLFFFLLPAPAADGDQVQQGAVVTRRCSPEGCWGLEGREGHGQVVLRARVSEGDGWWEV